MSITDDVRAAQPQGGERNPRPSDDGAFERTPPQDIAAEQCVLGGMLLSKDAIADVSEIVRTVDFYRPAHGTIFDIILNLYGRGEPADPITVAAALADSGDLARIGGVPYLHDLVAIVPTAANAAYYARIVAERAVLRRLVEAGTRIVQLGYGAAGGGGRDVDETVDRAQQEIYNVTEKRVSEDFAMLADMLQPTLDEIEAVGAQGGVMTGIPTGFTDLDRLLNGLHAGQLIIVAGRPGLGKALALDTPLPTPDGWTTMGEVSVGGVLIGADGLPTVVTATTPVLLGRPCYEVRFSDGAVIVADGSHRWLTHTRSSLDRGAPPAVRTTEEIAATLRVDSVDEAANHSVPHRAPFQLPDRDLPVPPYTLGVWLASSDARVESPLAPSLQSLGVLVDRHVPVEYLRASERQRRELLAGLLDAAGMTTPAGEVLLRLAPSRLADDVYDLVIGFGYRCVLTAEASGEHALTFQTGDDVFRAERQRAEHKRLTHRGCAERPRYIVDVCRVPSVPVKCVSVDNVDHLYLAGRSMVPTHNSTAGMDFVRCAAVRNNLASAIFSLEMSKVEIVMRLLAAEARVPLHILRSGQLSDDDWTKLARRIGEISNAPLFVDDTPNMTLMEIRAKSRRLKQRYDLKLIVVDYLQLMSSPKKVESRQQEVAELSRGLKLLAKEVECPVVAVSQLNRGPEQRTDKRPQLSDLRESGCMTEDTTLLRADTGAPISFGDLLRNGHDGVLVWSLDARRRMVPAPITAVFPSGFKETFRLRLASGREVKASGNHLFLTEGGWSALDAMSTGDRIAVPHLVPEPISAGLGWTATRLGLLAHLLEGGRLRKGRLAWYVGRDRATAAFVRRAVASEFGASLRSVRRGRRWHLQPIDPRDAGNGSDDVLHGWLTDLGMKHEVGAEARMPAAIYGATRAELAVFIRHLLACGQRQQVAGGGPLSYTSSSPHLARGMVSLLARFGIVGRLHAVVKTCGRPAYRVTIADQAGVRTFYREIGVCGKRGWRSVRHLDDANDPRGKGRQEHRAPQLPPDDVFWDEVAGIDLIGVRPVYDATVKGTHNFVACDIIAHNSIEQDADVVILLHRDDYYDKESPRAGEADFIVAKHRNGPTDTVTVAAQLHLSRFVDMAM